MAIESRGKWTDLIKGVGLDIADIFDQGQEEYIPGISNLLISTSGDGAQVSYSGKTGSGRLRKFDDGDDLPGGSRSKTYTTQVVYTNYGEFIDVTKNTIEDRNFQAKLDEMKDLSIGANFSQDEAGMQLFNGAFATTTLVNSYEMTWYGDGKPQASIIHPTTVPGGSTQSNASSTGITFGDDNLEIARIAMTLQQTDDGLPLSLLGKMMIVLPFTLDKKGQQITGSEFVSENANNALNIYRGASMDMTSSIFLDTTNGGLDTRWSVIVPKRAAIYHEVRQSPSLESEVNIKNKVATFTIDARWANYSREWKRTWYSKGDSSNYAA